jgi:hypothetical protein
LERGARIAPRRADIRPEDIRDLLPYVFLLDVIGLPHRFRVRLVGTSIVHEYGQEITGRFVDQIDISDMRSRLLAEYDEAVTRRVPVANSWCFTKHDGREVFCQHIAMPLSRAGSTIDMLFGGAVLKGTGPL